jgi:hypothetical protein
VEQSAQFVGRDVELARLGAALAEGGRMMLAGGGHTAGASESNALSAAGKNSRNAARSRSSSAPATSDTRPPWASPLTVETSPKEERR